MHCWTSGGDMSYLWLSSVHCWHPLSYKLFSPVMRQWPLSLTLSTVYVLCLSMVTDRVCHTVRSDLAVYHILEPVPVSLLSLSHFHALWEGSKYMLLPKIIYGVLQDSIQAHLIIHLSQALPGRYCPPNMSTCLTPRTCNLPYMTQKVLCTCDEVKGSWDGSLYWIIQLGQM